VTAARSGFPGDSRLVLAGAGAGLAGLAVCAVAAARVPRAFYPSYLAAYLFWLAIALGSLAVLMLHYVVGGSWGFLVRRVLEASARTLPVLALLFLPLLAGLPELYPWARPAEAEADPVLRARTPYLNVPFFLGRAAAYFAVWLLLLFLLDRLSRAQDRTRDPALGRRLAAVSGPGLIAYGLTLTFASVDWAMSLEPHWASSIYGMIFMAGQGLSAFAFAGVCASRLGGRTPFSEAATPQRLHDLGNLLLAFVLLWAYVSFAQYLLVWGADLPEEVPWYLRRTRGGWRAVAVFLICFHFAAPFLLLLSRDMKRLGGRLGVVAGLLLGARAVDSVWLVVPPFEDAGAHPAWIVPAALAGIGGPWLALFARALARRPLLPTGDPRFAGPGEAASHA
jgi:hypothetical protein